jgi:hypothetical protein
MKSGIRSIGLRAGDEERCERLGVPRHAWVAARQVKRHHVAAELQRPPPPGCEIKSSTRTQGRDTGVCSFDHLIGAQSISPVR